MNHEPPSLPSKRVRIAVFAGLCWLYGCIHFDRQILGILADYVKADLGLSDQALGALTGSAFSIVFALLGLYFGPLADQLDRLRLARLGACLWSLASMAAGFASSYAVLVAARAGIAVGEAIAIAATVSLMAELAGDRYRAGASSVFVTFAFIGAGSAAMVGGAVVQYFAASTSIVGWRAALWAAGLPGLAGAFYLSLFRWHDVHRKVKAASSRLVTVALVCAAAGAALLQIYWPPQLSVPCAVALAVAAVLLWLRRLRRANDAAFQATLGQASFRLLLLSFAAVLFVDSAAGFWLLPYAQRRFGISAIAAGTQLGGLMILGGIIGCLAGGWAADRWHRRTSAGRVWTALIIVLAEGLSILLTLSQGAYPPFLMAFSLFCLTSGGWAGIAAAIALDILPAQHRGTGTAAYFLVTTLLGPALGAFVVGWSSDMIGSVGRALAFSCSLFVVAGIGLIKLAHSVPSRTGNADIGQSQVAMQD